MRPTLLARIGGALFLGGLAAGGLWLGLSELLPFFQAVGAGAPVAYAAPWATGAVSVSIGLALMPAAGLVRLSEARLTRLFGTALVLMAGVLVAPILFRIATAYALPARGYHECDETLGGSRAVTRVWVRGGPAACEGAMVAWRASLG